MSFISTFATFVAILCVFCFALIPKEITVQEDASKNDSGPNFPLFDGVIAGADDMNITVDLSNGLMKFQLTIAKSEAVKNAKLKIEEYMGIPEDQQKLSFNGKELENDHSLLAYNTRNNSTLHLRVGQDPKAEKMNGHRSSLYAYVDIDGSFEIEVRPRQSLPQILTVNNLYSKYTIQTVKEMFQQEEPTLTLQPFKLYRLDGTLLENERTLKSYGIRNRELLLIKVDSENKL